MIVIYDIININLNPVISKLSEINGAISVRKIIWDTTFHIFTESPLMGIGFGGLKEAFHFFNLPLRISLPNPDFDLLQILAEGGIISLLIILAFIYWIFAIEKKNVEGLSSIYKKYLLGLDLAMVLFFLHSFFAYVFFFPMTHYIFVAILGVRNGILVSKRSKKKNQEKFQRI